jgi:hypothetical protein
MWIEVEQLGRVSRRCASTLNALLLKVAAQVQREK